MLRKIKWFFQRVFRGYSDYDMIDFSHFLLGKKVLPYLKTWVKSERIGYPVNLESMEEWNKVLDKIVWSMEEVVTNKTENQIFDEYEKDRDGEKLNENMRKNWEKITEGMELFGKYVTAMWD